MAGSAVEQRTAVPLGLARENGGEMSHVELLELAVCNVCGVLDGT